MRCNIRHASTSLKSFAKASNRSRIPSIGGFNLLTEADEKVRMKHCKEPERIPNATSLDVALVGPPNAGKSTILNKLCKQKISATSHKINTTRSRVLGILTQDHAQIIFHDTPGIIHEAEYNRFIKPLATTAEEALSSVDVIMLCIDSSKRVDAYTKFVIEKVATSSIESKTPVLLVLNKVDLVTPKHRLLDVAEEINNVASDAMIKAGAKPPSAEHRIEMAEKFDEELLEKALSIREKQMEGQTSFNVQDDYEIPDFDKLTNKHEYFKLLEEEGRFRQTFMVSALQNDGVGDIVSDLITRSKPRRWSYHSEEKSLMSDVDRVSEVIREKIYRQIDKEVPYTVDLQNIGWTNMPNGTLRIDHELIVFSKSHRSILIGKDNHAINRISRTSAVELEKIFQRKINLELSVKLKNGKARYHQFHSENY